MDALLLVMASGAALLVAYFTYGRWLSRRVFQLDDSRPTPAVTEADGRDYVPTRKSIIFGHHFTSIAGTGPIVGPAIAVMWGWLPAILWVVLGAIFVGAVHDLGSIVVSLRNKGRSIGDVAGDLLGPRARFVFLSILIVGLWIVLAVFGLVIAAVLRQYPAAVFPVVVQIPLAVVIGLLVHRRGGSIVWPSIISLALMYASVVWGDWGVLHVFNTTLAAQPLWVWTIGLLAYAYVASVLPVWVLLQPRDYINALQLISALGLIVAGLIAAATLGGPADSGRGFTAEAQRAAEGGLGQEVGEDSVSSLPIQSSPSASSSASSALSAVNSSSERPRLAIVAPMINWQPVGAPPMLPVLFITIACGACSGFHCLVGSGTTSKQIAREGDARAVGYGSMLTEGFLATLVIAACAAGIGLGVTRTTPSDGSGYSSADGGTVYNVFFDALPRNTGEDLILGYRWEVHDVGTMPNNYPEMYPGPRDHTSTWSALFEPRGATIYLHGSTTTVHADGHSERTFEITWHDTAGRDTEPDTLAKSTNGELTWESGEGSVRTDILHERYRLAGRLAFDKQYESWSAAGGLARTVGAFVEGAANFVASLGIPLKIAIALMGVMVASFAGTTMDTACRLQRYVVQELASTFLPKRVAMSCPSCGYDLVGLGTKARRHEGTKGEDAEASDGAPSDASTLTCPECGTAHDSETLRASVPSCLRASPWNPFRYLATTHGATLFAVATALFLAFIPPPGTAWSLDVAGKGGLVLWPLFGATNQLLAGFAFVVITAWLIATRRPWWFAIVPGVFMLCVPASAMAWQAFIGNAANPSWLTQGNWVLVAVGSVTLGLEAWLLVEVGLRWRGNGRGGLPPLGRARVATGKRA